MPAVALLELWRKTGLDLDRDFLREGIALLTRLLMEKEVGEQIGAERYQLCRLNRSVVGHQ